MFYKCPYKYKYDDSPIPLSVTQIGELVHACAAGTNPEGMDKLVEYFTNNFCSDFSTKQMLYALMTQAYQWYKNNKDHIFISEQKLVGIWDEDYCLNSTPDVILSKETEKWLAVKVIDFKTSTFKQYEDENLWDSVLQPHIYWWLAMEYLWVDEVIFSYYVFDKKNRKEQEFKKKLTRKEVENKIDMVIKEYDTAKENNNYEPKKNKFCWFCKLKWNWCPLWARDWADYF